MRGAGGAGGWGAGGGWEESGEGNVGLGAAAPGPAILGAAKLGRGQRTLGADAGKHTLANVRVALMPAQTALGEGTATELVVRPLLDRQHAGGVGPVLKRCRPARMPERLLDLHAADG